MAIPFDQRLAKLRILIRRAGEECERRLAVYEKARQEAWQPVYEAQRAQEDLHMQYWRVVEELGYCGSCEKLIEECKCECVGFGSTANIKTGDNSMVVMFLNNQDDTLAAEGWRLMQRSEAGTLWSKPYDSGMISVPLL